TLKNAWTTSRQVNFFWVANFNLKFGVNGNIDTEWDDYKKELEKYGLSDYLAIKQKYYDQYQANKN
ncbi:hypothetical protein RQ651_04765, partial [Streptococcus pneumoniae]|nr:hypothetical protein [Streptococcus pneumoniae]